ncbi:MAG: hypothetical protein GTO41_11805 [Burkholderiales bacterium]|nr:hypothetical protein [Burkholderiales bacterium]
MSEESKSSVAYATKEELEALRAEITELRTLVADAFTFGANELRPLFGQGTLALVLDGCAEGLRKAGNK